MEKKKIIIIGGGVAGLTAGIYARKKGYEVMILEQGKKSGGMASSWDRKSSRSSFNNSYHFEGGLQWLFGSSPLVHRRLNAIWKETNGLRNNNPIIIHDPVITLVHKGKIIRLFRDFFKTRREFLKYSPDDVKSIETLCRDVRLFALFQKHDRNVTAILRRIVEVIPFCVRNIQLYRMSVSEYVAPYRHKGIKKLLLSVTDPENAALCLISMLAAFSNGDGGYPYGGSMMLVDNLQSRFLKLGGTIVFKQWVSKVVIRNGVAAGVISEGDFLPADEVIVACDTKKALDSFFDEPLKEEWVEKIRQTGDKQQCMFITIGVAADLSDYSANMRLMLDHPLEVGGVQLDCLEVHNYADIKEYAPRGCTALTVVLKADCYDYWRNARKENDYIHSKDEAVRKVLRILEDHFPEIKGKVETAEMATPMTFEFFVNSCHGGWMGRWRPRTSLEPFQSTCKTVKGLHFAGHGSGLFARSDFFAGADLFFGLSSAVLGGYTAANVLYSTESNSRRKRRSFSK